MSSQKVQIDVNEICDADSKVRLRSYGGVFSRQIDMLTSRADILNAKDRTLMKMYLKNGMTFRQIAQVAGTNEAIIARKIHRLSSQLTEGEYITCLRNRDKFTQIEMDVARDYFISGLPQRRIAKKRGVKRYSIRKILLKIRNVVSEFM